MNSLKINHKILTKTIIVYEHAENSSHSQFGYSVYILFLLLFFQGTGFFY